MSLNPGHAALMHQKVGKFLYSRGPNKTTSVFILTNYPSVCRKSSCYICNFVTYMIFLFFFDKGVRYFLYITFCFSLYQKKNMLAMLFSPTKMHDLEWRCRCATSVMFITIYIVMFITFLNTSSWRTQGKTVTVKKHYSSVAVQGRAVSQEEVIVLLLPLHFTSFFQQLYVYNNHITMFLMFWNTSSQGNR